MVSPSKIDTTNAFFDSYPGYMDSEDVEAETDGADWSSARGAVTSALLKMSQ